MKRFIRNLFEPTKKRSFASMFVVMLILAIMAGAVAGMMMAPLALAFNQFKGAADNVIDDIQTEDYNGSFSSQTTMYANDNTTVLATFYAQDRIVVPFDKISQNLKNAVIAREDKRFYEHSGLDAMGLIRGFLKTTSSTDGSDMQGGSTITQQYIKNLLIDKALQNDDPIEAFHAKEQTLYRKIKEAKFAFEIESKLSKDQILEGYLNVAPFGPNVYGAESSAKRYFSKSAADLNIGEAAMIASITKSPVMYDPFTYPDETKKQRDTVLMLMHEQNYITEEEFESFSAIPIQDMLHPSSVPIGCQTAGNAAFFCDYVTNVILNDQKFGKTKQERKNLLYQGGLSIYTTLDKNFQDAATDQAKKLMPPDSPHQLEDAIATVEPGTGKILALAQNRDYNPAQTDGNAIDTAVNYAVGSKLGGSSGFSPGSTFKPVILTEWLKEGHTLNEAPPSRYPFNSSQFACSNGFSNWTPHNANGGTSNSTALGGIQQSLNITFINIASVTGLCTIFQTAKEMGFEDAILGDVTQPSFMLPSKLIGAMNATPLTMATVYATIASGGMRCNPIAINKIVTSAGEERSVPTAGCTRALDEDVANAVQYALKSSVTSGLARYAAIPGFDVGAKTGTSDAANHLWTAGFIKQAATAIWLGNAQFDQDITFIGSYQLANYWSAYMKAAVSAAGLTNQPFGTIDPKYLAAKATVGQYVSPDANTNSQPAPVKPTTKPPTTYAPPPVTTTTKPKPTTSSPSKTTTKPSTRP